MNLNNDSLGYEQDLSDALLALQQSPVDQRPGAIADAIFCFGRCLIFGFSTRVANTELLDRDAIEIAQVEMSKTIAAWADAAVELPEQWDATWQDDEAFLLCQSILERRTDAWAAELAFRELQCPLQESLQQAIERFDETLHGQQSILSTVSDSTWWENQRQSISEELLHDAWWLNDSLQQYSTLVVHEATESMPTSAQWATVRSSALWKAALPELIGMAARSESNAAKSRVVYWCSPCQKYKAVLMLPERITEAEAATLRSLFIMHTSDETLANEFAGQPFMLAGLQGIFDEQATAKIRLSEVMAGCNGQLTIGEPAVVWRIELEPRTNSGDAGQ